MGWKSHYETNQNIEFKWALDIGRFNQNPLKKILPISSYLAEREGIRNIVVFAGTVAETPFLWLLSRRQSDVGLDSGDQVDSDLLPKWTRCPGILNHPAEERNPDEWG